MRESAISSSLGLRIWPLNLTLKRIEEGYKADCFVFLLYEISWRPKVRRLVQHGGPPGWLEDRDPAGCDFSSIRPTLSLS
jgi:hypothetical protein